MRSILFLLLLCGIVCPATAQVYKWVDAKGNVQYSDTPPPPKEAKNVEQKKLNGNLVESDSMTYEGKIAAQKNPITLYFFDPCGDPCAKAQSLLEKRGVPYTLKNQEQDKLELKNLTGDTQMPVLVVGALSPSQGFEEGAWNRLLDQAGYPKSNPLAEFHKTAPKPVPVPAPVAAPAPAKTQ